MSSLMQSIRRMFSGRHSPAAVMAGSNRPGNTVFSEHDASSSGSDGDVQLQHLWCDQDNALKLQIDRTLLPLGESRGYGVNDDASDSPLARAIFTIPGIQTVLIESAFITVEMDADADWEGIRDQLPLYVRKFFLAGGAPFTDHPTTTEKSTMSKFNFGFKQIESRPRDEQMRIVSELFEKEINPAVQSHGGFFKLLDIKDNNVYVELGGGCQGCSMANVTLRQGVEARLREELPEMVALIDSTDHASGSNPYFSDSKK